MPLSNLALSRLAVASSLSNTNLGQLPFEIIFSALTAPHYGPRNGHCSPNIARVIGYESGILRLHFGMVTFTFQWAFKRVKFYASFHNIVSTSNGNAIDRGWRQVMVKTTLMTICPLALRLTVY
ncbi:hypothetical protein CDAR_260261 [Caerostris darwini]|uniref:Uncharacterized protein n=1 Tax=Caerostris darwini TaxID=1538125 RepID=A0AAV4VHI6_9ARAC|nr:hypothetical protein CDAR_260261 [Caerostris darwini]